MFLNPQTQISGEGSSDLPNCQVGRFYDKFGWLYPAIDPFFRPGRRWILEHINREPYGSLLEIGVGPGRHLKGYVGRQITAVDCSSDMVSRAAQANPHCRILQMDGEALTFESESFDQVCLFHVLSVTGQPDRLLDEVHRVLRPQGRLYVLNHESRGGILGAADRLIMPLARRLQLHSSFQLSNLDGLQRFELLESNGVGICSLFQAGIYRRKA